LGRRNNRGEGGVRIRSGEPAPSARTSQPAAAATADPQQHQYQLGHYTLGAVDQLTGMTADEIELVADRVMEGARETEDVLRELAHRVREYGVVANERLANFVKAANGCTDLARTMQGRLEQRDLLPAEESFAETQASAPEAATATAERPHDPDSIEAEIEGVAHDRAPPTQPGD
jgi:hypothetical protein